MKKLAFFGAFLAAAFAILLAAGPASAHSVLLSTAPPTAKSVPVAPESVALTFNEEPRGQYSTIHVTGPDGRRRDDGAVSVVNDVVTEHLAGSRPAGRYVVDWRVVSTDGHPVSGQFSFTAQAAGSQLAALPASASTGKSSSGSSTGVIIGIAAAVVIIGGFVGWLTLRRHRPPVHE